ncbi:MAG: hypothetical protein RLZZ361_1222 [Cyanobacteriota bacterium]|jgi:hypothetical protein
MSSSDSVSIKELASKLKTSDALIKKIIKDFEIETTRNQKRVLLSAESVQTIRDILALRASGKKNIEIKKLFDEANGIKPASDPDSNNSIDTEETPAEVSAETLPETKKPKKNKPAKLAKQEPSISESAEIISKSELNPNPQDIGLDVEGLSADDILELTSLPINQDVDVLVPGDYLEDEIPQSNTQDDLKQLLSLEGSEDLEEDLEDEITDEQIEEELTQQNRRGDRLSPRKIRRRQFSFRYIQRQIANDSKRVNYIKQKLRRGSLSTKERMVLEDSLHHRSVLLSGWIQLLRWVKS